MPDLSPGAKRALGLYWGAIEAASSSHMTTADLWTAIRQAAADAGLESPGVNAADVSTIRGYAGRMTRASEALAKAEPGLGLTADLIATPPWARPLAEQNAVTKYQVTYSVNYVTPEGESGSRFLTSVYDQLPGTVGDLLSGLQVDASELQLAQPEGDYLPGDITGVDTVTILAV